MVSFVNHIDQPIQHLSSGAAVEYQDFHEYYGPSIEKNSAWKMFNLKNYNTLLIARNQ